MPESVHNFLPKKFHLLPARNCARIFLEARQSSGHLSGVFAYLSALILGYLFGSFPSGYVVGRCHGVDLRKEGSGNIGATNAVRVLGKKWGVLVFALDALKGGLAVACGFQVAKYFGASEQHVINAGVVAAICAVVGHNYPVWLNFQGGKGIAVSAGIMLALFPPMVFISGLAVWLALFFGTRYVSIASLGSAVALPTSALLLHFFGQGDGLFGQCDWVRAAIAILMGSLAIWRHKPNIERLLAGTEKRFDRKSKKSTNV